MKLFAVLSLVFGGWCGWLSGVVIYKDRKAVKDATVALDWKDLGINVAIAVGSLATVVTAIKVLFS